MSEHARHPLRRADYRPPDHRIDEVDLGFDLREQKTLVRATLRGRANEARGPGRRSLVLDGEGLETRRVALDGVELSPADYQMMETSLSLEVPDPFTLETEVALRPAENASSFGLYRSGAGLFTDLEPTGFRRVTWFPDRPDVLARYRTRIEADRDRHPVLLSNGNRAGRGSLPGGRHYALWEDHHPKPCYLFALVAADLRKRDGVFTTRSGRRVRLEVWVEPRDVGRAGHALESLERAMRWDEERFGREVDLDIYMIVAVSDFNGGAMENKGLNIFNSKLVLADPRAATDEDYASIEGAVGHEYFHNWTGNRVTLRDWFQLTLKEGLTVYRDQEFSAESTFGPAKRISSVKKLREKQFPQDAGPMAHPVRPEEVVEIGNLYTATVYDKGAEVVRMVETLLGREGFRRGMDLYFERHDGQAVTCKDFLAAMADANGADLSRFARWYRQSGTPVVTAMGQAEPTRGAYALTLHQEPAPEGIDPGPLVIPIRTALLGPGGEPVGLRLEGEDAGGGPAPTERVLVLDERERTFRFLGVQGPLVPSLLRGFSAPVRCRIERSRAGLAFLLAHDTDPVARWDAGQELALDVVLERLEAGDPPHLDPELVAAFRDVLADGRTEPGLRALAIGLPGEAVLAERVGAPVDPETVHRARRSVEGELGRALRPELMRTYADLEQAPPGAPAPDRPSPDRLSIGRRALKNVALAYLCAAGDEDAHELARRQAAEGRTMTDVLAGLGHLVDQGGAKREEALSAFHRRWRHDPLALDKWFAVQAASNTPDTFERVAALTAHADFQPRNPNRLLALLSTFAHGNPARFHRPDGAAYELLAGWIEKVDRQNPKMAARLATAFLPWRRLEPARRARLEEMLRRLDGAGLSTAAGEIVGRALRRAAVPEIAGAPAG